MIVVTAIIGATVLVALALIGLVTVIKFVTKGKKKDERNESK